MPEQVLPRQTFLQDLLNNQSGQGAPCNPCDNPNYKSGTQGQPCAFVPTTKIIQNPIGQPQYNRNVINRPTPSFIDLTRKILGYPLYGDTKRLNRRLINICRNDRDNTIPDTYHPYQPPQQVTRQWRIRAPTTNPGGACACRLLQQRPVTFKNGLDKTQQQFITSAGKKLDLQAHNQINQYNPFHNFAVRAPSRQILTIPNNKAIFQNRPCISTPSFFGQAVLH